MTDDTYIHVTQEAGARLFGQNAAGPIVMLNMLRFRNTADYSASPELEPEQLISGRHAYRLYSENTLPLLLAAGGEVIYTGNGGPYLIGPATAQWDLVLLVRHRSLEDFAGFTRNPAYLAGVGHRTAALSDSRLLPLVLETRRACKQKSGYGVLQNLQPHHYHRMVFLHR